MAPEVMVADLNEVTVSTKLDMYAVGTLFWSLITFKLPFEDENPSIFWMADFFQKGSRLPLSPGCCPIQLYSIIHACWDLDASLRPSISTVALEVRKLGPAHMANERDVSHGNGDAKLGIPPCIT